jgi:hypothetical protein
MFAISRLFAAVLFRSRASLPAENLALRHQFGALRPSDHGQGRVRLPSIGWS